MASREVSHAPDSQSGKTLLALDVDILPENQTSTRDIKETICDFIDKTNLSALPEYKRDLELESRIKDVTKFWANEETMRPYITVGVAMAVTAYSHLPTVEAKLQIVLYTAILAYLDDPAVFDSLGAGNFHRRLCAGSVQHDTNILGALATNMVEMFACFPRFSASSILTSALRFVNGSMIENTCGGALLSPHSLSFVKYRRELTGIAEAYAAFIWEKSKFPDVGVYIQALPYVMQYLAYANDVMSFYKEELVGEVDNYVHGRAAATGKPVPEAFRDTVDETVAASDRVRTILGEGEARDVWDTFIKGYVYFHIISTRYRLHEILGDQYRWDIDHPTVPKYANSE